MANLRSHVPCIAMALALLLCTISIAHPQASDTHLPQARQLIAEGKPTEAMVEYEAVLVADPSNLEALGNLGVLQFFANDCSSALPHLSAAFALDPSQSRIQALVGICQRRQNHLEEAERNLDAALPLVTNPKIHNLILTNLVEIESARGDLVQAAKNVAELTRSDSSDPDALYFAYRIYTDLADSARNTLAIAAPDSARMHLLTAERFVNVGDAAHAIQQYQLALAKDPSLLGVHYEMGEAILRDSVGPDSLNRAFAELQLALTEEPRNAGAEAKLGVIEGLRGHSDLAEAHYTRALSINPDELDALVGLGHISHQRGDLEKAASYLSHACKIDAMNDSLHFQLAQIDRDLGKKADAENEMKIFLSIRGLKEKSSMVDVRRTAQ